MRIWCQIQSNYHFKALKNITYIQKHHVDTSYVWYIIYSVEKRHQFSPYNRQMHPICASSGFYTGINKPYMSYSLALIFQVEKLRPRKIEWFSHVKFFLRVGTKMHIPWHSIRSSFKTVRSAQCVRIALI